MRIFGAATAAHLAARGDMLTHALVWIEAVNLETELVEGLGLWTGDYDLSVSIGGAQRTYIGAGDVLKPEPVVAGTGIVVRTYQVALAGASERVQDIVKGYRTRFAPIEVHRAHFRPDTEAMLDTPERVFRGLINSPEVPTVPAGGETAVLLSCVTKTRELTRTLSKKKSAQAQQARGGDQIRRYGTIADAVPIYWGEQVEQSGGSTSDVFRKLTGGGLLGGGNG